MIRTVFYLLLAFMVVSTPACSGANSPQADPKLQGDNTTSAETWPEDLSGKVDKTIQVLSVIKTELERMKEQDAAKQTAAHTTSAAPSDDEWADSMKGKLSSVIRMWKKTEEIIDSQKANDPQAQAASAAAAADMNAKIDKAIKAMEVIKEELDAVNEKPSSAGNGSTQNQK